MTAPAPDIAGVSRREGVPMSSLRDDITVPGRPEVSPAGPEPQTPGLDGSATGCG
jgi:hypothetical protein